MFSQMISDLQKSTLPENKLLRKRFEAALIKKMGVIRTPCSFWSSDTKINPPAKQLLWAAILLHDKENFKVVETIMGSELEEKQRAKGQPEDLQTIAPKVRRLLQEYIDEFLSLAPDETFKYKLQQMTQDFLPS